MLTSPESKYLLYPNKMKIVFKTFLVSIFIVNAEIASD